MIQSSKIIIFKQIAIIIILFILGLGLALVLNFSGNFRFKFKERLNKNFTSESSLYKSKNTDDILDFLKKVDKIIFSVPAIYDDIENGEVKFSSEHKIDVAIAYIIQNLDKYQNEIKTIDKNFVYMEDDTCISALGFVNKSLIRKIVFKIFGQCDIIFSSYKLYDSQTDMIALVPILMDNVRI